MLVYFFGLLHFKSVHFGKWLNLGDDYIGSGLLAQEGIVFLKLGHVWGNTSYFRVLTHIDEFEVVEFFDQRAGNFILE